VVYEHDRGVWKEAMRCLKRHLANVVYRAMLEDRCAPALTT